MEAQHRPTASDRGEPGQQVAQGVDPFSFQYAQTRTHPPPDTARPGKSGRAPSPAVSLAQQDRVKSCICAPDCTALPERSGMAWWTFSLCDKAPFSACPSHTGPARAGRECCAMQHCRSISSAAILAEAMAHSRSAIACLCLRGCVWPKLNPSHGLPGRLESKPNIQVVMTVKRLTNTAPARALCEASVRAAS
jgi:hypothetical protein